MKSKILWIVATVFLVLMLAVAFVPPTMMQDVDRAHIVFMLSVWTMIFGIMARIEDISDACKALNELWLKTNHKASQANAKLFLHEYNPKPHEDSDLARVNTPYGFDVGQIEDDFIMNRHSVRLIKRKRNTISDISAKVRQEAREALQENESKRSCEWFCNFEDDLK